MVDGWKMCLDRSEIGGSEIVVRVKISPVGNLFSFSAAQCQRFENARSLLFLFESAVDRSAEKRSNFESGVLQEVDRKYDFGSDCFRIP